MSKEIFPVHHVTRVPQHSVNLRQTLIKYHYKLSTVRSDSSLTTEPLPPDVGVLVEQFLLVLVVLFPGKVGGTVQEAELNSLSVNVRVVGSSVTGCQEHHTVPRLHCPGQIVYYRDCTALVEKPDVEGD